METRVGRIEEVPVSTRLPATIANPIEPERFVGRHEQRLARAAGRNAHRFVNRSDAPVTLLVVGSRRPGEDLVHYPDHQLGPIG